ncbi:AI-2E family transporter [Nocardioides euryhalodurans]|uniref:AI-2E family transporter n=1 Tax=Nocardioides euryhalodurans TaxID=2518370 RepID=UPI001FC8F6FA|nr:AI-2E family transporter [Nocardioides euryhalodurans]
MDDDGDRSGPGEEHAPRRRLPILPGRSHDEGLAERLAQQWATARAERRPEPPPPIRSGPSNVARAQVPYGVDLAAAWAWRFLVIAAAGYLLFRVIGFFSVIALPIAISLLIAALVAPLVRLLDRALPHQLSSAIVVVGGLASVGLLLTFVGQQVATGATDLADSVVDGIGQIRAWLEDGPLKVSDSQLDGYLTDVQRAITETTREGGVLTQIGEVGTAVGHVVAGFFIVLFATFFFIADGERIWAWTVRLAPRAAREKVDSSGQVAWRSTTQFVRATVIVAAVDAIGVMIVAAVLGVPFVLAIGVLVFLGAFVPMVGATVAGTVAILVALVDQGPITALLMLAGVIAVQQIEGHVLQPFLMGRFVSVHPLGVIVAIGCGVLVAGIAGALVAVPLASAVNAVVQHLASQTDVGEDPQQALADEVEREPVEPVEEETPGD